MKNFFDNLELIAPHIIAIIAIVVPAISSAKARKYSLEEKRIDWLMSQWSEVYCDFCTYYAEYISNGYDRETGEKLGACAFKLAIICDDESANALHNFAEWVTTEEKEFIDRHTLTSLFDSCSKAVRKALTESNTALPASAPGAWFRRLHSRGFEYKKPNQ